MDRIGALARLVHRPLIDPGGKQHIRAGALHEPQIIGVIDHAGEIGVLEIDTQDEMMLLAFKAADGWQSVHAPRP